MSAVKLTQVLRQQIECKIIWQTTKFKSQKLQFHHASADRVVDAEATDGDAVLVSFRCSKDQQIP